MNPKTAKGLTKVSAVQTIPQKKMALVIQVTSASVHNTFVREEKWKVQLRDNQNEWNNQK